MNGQLILKLKGVNTSDKNFAKAAKVYASVIDESGVCKEMINKIRACFKKTGNSNKRKKIIM